MIQPMKMKGNRKYFGRLSVQQFHLNLLFLLSLILSCCGNLQRLPWITAATSPTTNVILSGGLDNLGNTCYLNAQLECAYHIPKVRDCILNISENENQNLGLLSLRRVFQNMYEASKAGNGNPLLTPSTSTRSLCHGLGINVYEQQDSQEFWKLLLPELQHETLTKLYKGQFESYIVALDGSGREKRRLETFFDLSLDVSNFDNVGDSLQKLFKSGETLSVKDGNGWRPEKGADKVDALKGYTLHSNGLPSILQLHLMRFKYDMMSGTMSKINDRFIFPKELDLTKICEDEQEEVLFDLQSVVIHAGEYGSGHYYAYVRPDIMSNRWYRYDDTRVTEVPYKQVKEDAFGGAFENHTNRRRVLKKRFWATLFTRSPKENYGWGGKKSCAYMLQYIKRKEIKSLY